jgi:hypothetical protein
VEVLSIKSSLAYTNPLFRAILQHFLLKIRQLINFFLSKLHPEIQSSFLRPQMAVRVAYALIEVL